MVYQIIARSCRGRSDRARSPKDVSRLTDPPDSQARRTRYAPTALVTAPLTRPCPVTGSRSRSHYLPRPRNSQSRQRQLAITYALNYVRHARKPGPPRGKTRKQHTETGNSPLLGSSQPPATDSHHSDYATAPKDLRASNHENRRDGNLLNQIGRSAPIFAQLRHSAS